MLLKSWRKFGQFGVQGDKVGIPQIRQVPKEEAIGSSFPRGGCRINPIAEVGREVDLNISVVSKMLVPGMV